nr:uncharacterized protein LOC109183853 isoform X1 [Ipomoea batatas]
MKSGRCNESERAENNLKRRNAYSAMDPDKKRKMLDERNEKRQAKMKEAQSLQIRPVNAVQLEIVLNISNQESLQQNDNLSSIPYQSFVLKDCPPCTYCNARRFQYEPPGFCCSSGQVVLVSNQMPSLLKQLFSEKDEVSR